MYPCLTRSLQCSSKVGLQLTEINLPLPYDCWNERYVVPSLAKLIKNLQFKKLQSQKKLYHYYRGVSFTHNQFSPMVTLSHSYSSVSQEEIDINTVYRPQISLVLFWNFFKWYTFMLQYEFHNLLLKNIYKLWNICNLYVSLSLILAPWSF